MSPIPILDKSWEFVIPASLRLNYKARDAVFERIYGALSHSKQDATSLAHALCANTYVTTRI